MEQEFRSLMSVAGSRCTPAGRSPRLRGVSCSAVAADASQQLTQRHSAWRGHLPTGHGSPAGSNAGVEVPSRKRSAFTFPRNWRVGRPAHRARRSGAWRSRRNQNSSRPPVGRGIRIFPAGAGTRRGVTGAPGENPRVQRTPPPRTHSAVPETLGEEAHTFTAEGREEMPVTPGCSVACGR
jgi:hypothetical protein